MGSVANIIFQRITALKNNPDAKDRRKDVQIYLDEILNQINFPRMVYGFLLGKVASLDSTPQGLVQVIVPGVFSQEQNE